MRIAIISDTHCFHDQIKEIPDADLLIHCGDALNSGTFFELIGFRNWGETALAKFPRKIYVPGNHDRIAESEFYIFRDELDKVGFEILCDSGLSINGINFYGSPYVPQIGRWAFMLPRRSEALKTKFERIPEDTHVLITHGPAFSKLDTVSETSFEFLGCEQLQDRLLNGLESLRMHCFGHIHGGYGCSAIESPNGNRRLYHAVNAAICDESYSPVNLPWLLEISEDDDHTVKLIEW